MFEIDVYNTTETFEYGRAAGFYDALSDDGLRYFETMQRYRRDHADNESLVAGYRAGRTARRGNAFLGMTLVRRAQESPVSISSCLAS